MMIAPMLCIGKHTRGGACCPSCVVKWDTCGVGPAPYRAAGPVKYFTADNSAFAFFAIACRSRAGLGSANPLTPTFRSAFAMPYYQGMRTQNHGSRTVCCKCGAVYRDEWVNPPTRETRYLHPGTHHPHPPLPTPTPPSLA